MPPKIPARIISGMTQKPCASGRAKATPAPASAPMMYCPSAPMFQILARFPSERPSAMMMSGAALVATSCHLYEATTGVMKVSEIARGPSKPINWKMIAPSSIVRSTEATGVATCMKRLGVSRFSSRMRMQGLCHFDRRRRVAVHAAHEQADLLDRHFANLHRRRQAAEIDDRDRVAKGKKLVEVLRDDHDRRAARGQIDDRLVDRSRRARVDPPGRLADHQRLRALQDLAPHDEFLQVAARERAGERARAGRLHGIGADHFGGVILRLRGVDEAETHHVHPVAP